jgi:hypothetical protein
VHLQKMLEEDSQSSSSLSPTPLVNEQNDIFHARPRHQALIFPPPHWGGGTSSQRGRQDTMTDMLAFDDIIVKVLESQAMQNLRWHHESQMALLENIQATSIAVTGTTQEAQLTKSKLRILQACSGFEDDASLFSPLQLYVDADREGGQLKHSVGSLVNKLYWSQVPPINAMCCHPKDCVSSEDSQLLGKQ